MKSGAGSAGEINPGERQPSEGVTPRPAATVILVRPTAGRGEDLGAGYEVFLVQRNRTVGFMPNAWVFPGGRVDPDDYLAGHPAVWGGDVATLHWGLARDLGIAFQVAAARETFEEAGVWLGTPPIETGARAAVNGGQVKWVEYLERGATLDLDRLRPWAWWVTPTIERRRYDTPFFIAHCPSGTEAVHDEGETVASCWLTPRAALEAVDRGGLPMAPPTWWTLTELAQHPTNEALWLAAGERSTRRVEPIGHRDADGAFELRLPGHPEHPEPPISGLPNLVRWIDGRWLATSGAAPSVPDATFQERVGSV